MPELAPTDGSVAKHPLRRTEHPVAEHREVGGALDDRRLVRLQPQQPRWRRDRDPVTGELVDALGRAAGDQLPPTP